MALKLKISPSVYEALSADVKKEYKQDGSDYTLDLEGYEDPTALRNARDHEKEAAAEAKRQAAAEKRRADDAEKKARELEASGRSVDDAVKAKEAEMQALLEASNKKLESLTGAVKDNHKQSIADKLASEISTAPKLLAPEIAKRIQVEIDENTYTPKATILGSDGKPSTWTVDDLKKDVLKNPDYAVILRGTKANGGGGAPSVPGGGGASRQFNAPGTPPPDLTKMDPAQLAALITAQKEAEGRA